MYVCVSMYVYVDIFVWYNVYYIQTMINYYNLVGLGIIRLGG